jgi:hypothetical protein
MLEGMWRQGFINYKRFCTIHHDKQFVGWYANNSILSFNSDEL